jgi:hypothetical protein
MYILVEVCFREITDVFKTVFYYNISNITRYISLKASSALSTTNGSPDGPHEFLIVYAILFLEQTTVVLELTLSLLLLHICGVSKTFGECTRKHTKQKIQIN